jgi:RES domain-containing protein
MRLWRISDFDDLAGLGGLVAPARWHSMRRPLVYLADHPASALIEVLVHLEVDRDDLPATYQLLAVDIPDSVPHADAEALPPDWRSDGRITQQAGDDWLQAGATALLRVPSAIVPQAWNWLLNPRHSDAAQARVVEVTRVVFDPRLF